MFARIGNTLVLCAFLTVLASGERSASADVEANKDILERRVELWNNGDLFRVT